MPAAASEVKASGGPHTHTPKALTHTATAARRTEGVKPVTPISTSASRLLLTARRLRRR